MEYITFIHFFWKKNKDFELGTISISLYFYLLESWFNNNCNPIRISDNELCRNLKISRRSVKTFNQKLKFIGFIDFEKNQGKTTLYNILVPQESSLLDIPKVNEDIPKQYPLSSLKKETEKIDIEITVSSISQIKNDKIPSLIDFTNHAKSSPNYEENMEIPLTLMYNSMVKRGWRNSYDKPIVNWKSLLEKQLPFINMNSDKRSSLQTINRPKKTSNE